MKNLFLILAATIFVSSCGKLNKLVDEGRYDEAIYLATKKMKGDKNKKTKHVLALEESFNKMNDKDLRDAKFLENQGNPANWDKIHGIFTSIRERQDLVAPFLPLKSKDGYLATFNFVKVDPMIIQAAKKAASYHYEKALTLLVKAEQGNKLAGRKAMSELNDVTQYFSSYKDVDELKTKAIYLGKERILVNVVNESNIIIPAEFEREVLSISVRELNNNLREFYLNDRDNIDMYATLQIRNIEISPERETINHFNESKEIQDGYEYEYDSNGNVKKDTSGNDIKTKKYITVRAHVDEIFREKRAIVQGQIQYLNKHTNEVVNKRPVSVESIFEDYAVSFDGDRRALNDQTISRIKRRPDPFPSDFDMTLLAAEQVKIELKKDLNRFFK